MIEAGVPAVAGGAARLYAATLNAAAWLDAHRWRVAAVGGALLIAVLAWLHLVVLAGFANSGDEYVYLLQARTLLAGRLWWPAPAPVDLFTTSYVAIDGGRLFGTFPPGWPLALALAMAAGVPAWLVNPLIGVATLALVWTLGTQLYDGRTGALSAATLAVSPFFLFNAASYFSHPWCGLLLLAAASLAARDDRRPWWVATLTGALIGWAVITRYFTGAVAALPIVWWLLRPGVTQPRTIALVVLGGLPWVAGLMAYDTALTGSPWHLTMTGLTTSRWFANGWLLRGADIFASHLVRHLLWTPPVLVVAYVIYLRRGSADLRRGWFAWLPAAMALLLFFYVERGGNQYGARFHAEVFPFLVIVVVAHVFRAASYAVATPLDRVMFGLLAASVAVMPVVFTVHAVIEHAVVHERLHPFALATALGLDGALVLIAGRVGTRRSMAAEDLTRNPPGERARVLFGIDPGAGSRCAAVAAVPDRAVYLYRWDVAARDGTMSPLHCP